MRESGALFVAWGLLLVNSAGVLLAIEGGSGLGRVVQKLLNSCDFIRKLGEFMTSELLLGDEAVGLAALDAGIKGAFSYPGTPATEILESIQDYLPPGSEVAANWSVNEKVAYESALGMSYVGRRALVAMKHVGLNVASDPFMSSALTGAVGGIVLAVADDPSMHSSQNEQDSRFYGDFARVPMFEPADQQEVYDMTREAFEYSERIGLPVIVRLVTRLAHSRGIVERKQAAATKSAFLRGQPSDWTLLPSNARKRFRRLLELQSELEGHSENSSFNELNLRGPTGIIASGLAIQYVREVLGSASRYSLLKIGTYPLPRNMIRRLVHHCDDIVVCEEGSPFIEDRLTGLLGAPGKTIRGRRNGALPADGELNPDLLRAALGMSKPDRVDCDYSIPGRPPALCNGCPHCDTFKAVVEAVGREDGPILFSDIGCYTLGAFGPFNAVHSCVDMGASIGMAMGAAKAGVHPVVCTIGDSTFTHSGMTALLEAAHLNLSMTVVILDNATVAMTGGQEIFATGETLLRIIAGLGVDPKHLVQVEPFPKTQHELAALVQREIDHRGLSVIVASRPCIHMKRREKVVAGVS